jgi:hypothetical protein
MNKWRKRARKWGGEAEELRQTVEDLRGLVRFHRQDKSAMLSWLRRVREAKPSSCVHENRTGLVVIGATDWANFCEAIEAEPKEET